MIKIIYYVLIGVCFMNTPINNPSDKERYTRLSEIECQEGFGGQVVVREVRNLGRPYGYSIWLNDNKVKTAYFPSNPLTSNASRRYNDWKINHKVIMTSSGAYTTENKQPLGFTIEKGKAINRILNDQMDGIVVVQNGGLEVYNTQERFYFKPLHRTLNLKSVKDKSIFTAWANRYDATIFQTHLLVKNNKLIVHNNHHGKMAERKLLVSLRKGKEKYQVLFYIKRGEFLYNVAKEIQNYLEHQKDIYVESMINLDTGVYNILELSPSLKSCHSNVVKGTTNIYTAANLLTFYFN